MKRLLLGGQQALHQRLYQGVPLLWIHLRRFEHSDLLSIHQELYRSLTGGTENVVIRSGLLRDRSRH